jgi:hypothetical protein
MAPSCAGVKVVLMAGKNHIFMRVFKEEGGEISKNNSGNCKKLQLK